MTKKLQVIDLRDGITMVELSTAASVLRKGVTAPSPLPVDAHKHSYGTAVQCPLCLQLTNVLLIDVRTNYIGCEVCYGNGLGNTVDRANQLPKIDGDSQAE